MKRRLAVVPTLAALLLLTLTAEPARALEEPDRLYMVGERALADRFYPVARRALERFVGQYPDDPRLPQALLMLGRARLAADDAQSALEAFTRAHETLTAPGERLEARFWQAEALFRLKRFSEARDGYDEVVRTDAASRLAPDALYGFAWSEMELKQPESAVTALRQLLDTWPEHALAPAAALQLARAHIELKRLDDARPLLASFASKYPSSKLAPDAQFLLGWVKIHGGDPRGGAADLKSFATAHPRHEQVPAAQRLIIRTTGKHGTPEEMLAAYKVLIEDDPPTAQALSDAIDIANRLSRPRDAEAAWQKLRAEFPDHALTRRRAFEMASAAFKRKAWKDAVALGQVAARSDDTAVRAEAWLLVGEAELQLRRYTPAGKAFEAVGTLDGTDAGVRYRALAGLGLAREQLKQWKGALTAYEQVAKGSPDTSLRDWARERVTAVKGQLTRASGSNKGNGSASPGSRRAAPPRNGGKAADKKP